MNVARTTARHLVMQGMAGDERFYGVYDSMQRGGTVEDIDEEAERILEGCRQKAEVVSGRKKFQVSGFRFRRIHTLLACLINFRRNGR